MRLTGFRSLSEYHEETTEYERQLIESSIEQWHEEQADAGGGGGGGVPGL